MLRISPFSTRPISPRISSRTITSRRLAEPKPSTPVDDEEARLEALERQVRRKETPKPSTSAPSTKSSNAMTAAGMAEWKEGELFPEGWEQMSVDRKLSEIYMGKRGMLYWSQQAAWWSCGLMAGGWVLFRVILPATGLYKLPGDL